MYIAAYYQALHHACLHALACYLGASVGRVGQDAARPRLYVLEAWFAPLPVQQYLNSPSAALQVEERLDSGSLQLTDDLSILFGGSAARRRLQTPLSFNCGAPGLLQFYKWYGCIVQQAGPQLCEAAPELLRNILRGLGGLCT